MLEKNKKPLSLPNKFSWKFYIGMAFIIVSFVIGLLTHITFVLFFNNALILWLSVIIYVLSWLMLALGAWWVGKEYYDKIKKYTNLKFYEQSLKEGTKKAYIITKEKTTKFRDEAKAKTNAFKDKLKEKTKHRTNKVKENVRNRFDSVKSKVKTVKIKNPFHKNKKKV